MSEPIIALDIIVVFLDRKNYIQYKDLLNTDTLDRQTYDILQALGLYYKRDTTSDVIDIESFAVWFIQFYKLKLTEDEIQLYQIIFNNIKERRNIEHNCDAILKEFAIRATRQSILSVVHENRDLSEISKLLESTKNEDSSEIEFLGEGIETLMPIADPTEGLNWRLACLNRAIGPLSKSVFLVAAGRPDSGKTSLIMSEVTHMAQQLKDDEVILWFVTENTTAEAKRRAYCAMLERPWDDFWEFMRQGKFPAIDKAYKDKQGGIERIKFAQGSGISLSAIEKQIAKFNTKLVVFDMIDDLAVPKSMILNEHVSTAHCKALYKWGLEMACKHCPVIATSQLSVIVSDNPEYHKFPYMSALADSKTDKQAKATVLLFIGRYEHDNRRYLSTPKNKRKSNMNNFRACVQLDAAKSLFKPL